MKATPNSHSSSTPSCFVPGWRCISGLAAVLIAAVFFNSTAKGDLLYRETFGNTNSARAAFNQFAWQMFNADGTADNTTDGNRGVDTATTLGRPTNVSNTISAGPNADGVTTNALPA